MHSNQEVVEIMHVFLKLHPALYLNISASCLFLSVAPIRIRNVLTLFYLFTFGDKELIRVAL